MPSHLHIVSFNVPWPADYGGVIDVYYRLRQLADEGVRIHLHCYTYGRPQAKELERLCEEVHYYPRRTGLLRGLATQPYIVASRQSEELIGRLQQDDYPILLEGLHNGYVLQRLGCGSRKIALRAHNVEHDYYHALARAESNPWKRLYYTVEARKLQRYEPVLSLASVVLAISEADASHFRTLGCSRVEVVPPAHGHHEVTTQQGRGDYVLYHGDLSVAENRDAVRYILEELCPLADFRLVIAGRNPAPDLLQEASRHKGVTLIPNPDDERLHRLLADAQVNLLLTHQATGVKLKLLRALYEGRHCLVNSTMVQGTGLAEACHVADTPQELCQQLTQLMGTDFDEAQLDYRRQVLREADPQQSLKNIIL